MDDSDTETTVFQTIHHRTLSGKNLIKGQLAASSLCRVNEESKIAFVQIEMVNSVRAASLCFCNVQ